MGSILLKDISLNEKACDILIKGNLIDRISPAGSIEAPEGAEVVQCSRKAAIPGFVNMHCHAAMSLMRGLEEDVVFQDWISRIWETEAKIDADFVYWGSKVACLEMIKTGTTTVNDHYWFPHIVESAMSEMGMRCGISYILLDRGDHEEAARQKEQCRLLYEQSKEWKSHSQFVVGVHAPYSVMESMMAWAGEFARVNGLRLHIHLSETEKEVQDCKKAHGGLSPVEYLDKLGVLGRNVIAAHTLWLSENDIRILAERGVTCVHNINSNAKLTAGYRFLYNELRDAGVNVCIGTDGCASSNNLDMLEAMKTSALFQKAWRNDPKAMPLPELMRMATLNGAKALGIDAGEIREGALADISIVDTDNSFFLSPGTFLANLVYSAHSDCIDSVIIDGRFVMRHRIIEGEKEILHEATKVLNRLK